jgi:2'-5' RNA ligase
MLGVVAPGDEQRLQSHRECEAWRVDETALVVLVPEAEALVAAYRRRYDPSAAVGVPAHVTVLYPFRSVVDDAAADVVAELAADVAAFDVKFASLARFAGEVVYLAPDPAEPFLRLMAATFASFPDCPPYGGAIPDPVPHLTVADGVDASTAAAVDSAIGRGLPITSRVERLTLIAENPNGQWIVVRHWPLG